MSLSTHVLDTTRGRPAALLAVTLERRAGDGWARVGAGRTDGDGRLRWDAELPQGTYRLTFDTGGWFAAAGTEGFYPEVSIAFTVRDSTHHHVPLLLSPYGYSTYRGS
jgi:5-hydroxyisourate hydrolase